MLIETWGQTQFAANAKTACAGSRWTGSTFIKSIGRLSSLKKAGGKWLGCKRKERPAGLAFRILMLVRCAAQQRSLQLRRFSLPIHWSAAKLKLRFFRTPTYTTLV